VVKEEKKEKMKTYPVKGEKIVYMSDEEMEREVSKWYHPKWLARYIGGYCTPSGKTIYIKESRKGDEKLLIHERGHLLGYSHTLFPTIMFPSWAGRLFNTYFPYKRRNMK
jgi:hypothetical protein